MRQQEKDNSSSCYRAEGKLPLRFFLFFFDFLAANLTDPPPPFVFQNPVFCSPFLFCSLSIKRIRQPLVSFCLMSLSLRYLSFFFFSFSFLSFLCTCFLYYILLFCLIQLKVAFGLHVYFSFPFRMNLSPFSVYHPTAKELFASIGVPMEGFLMGPM